MSGNDSAGTRTTAVTLAVLVAASAITAVPGLVLFVQPAAANAPSTIAVTQGSNCFTVEPVGDGSMTVEEFYDYRTPETDPSSGTYSSFGTDDHQETGVSSMFFYEGSDGTSLVVVHDRLRDDDGGSTVSWSVSGLPEDGDLAVQDDYYQNGTQDDNFGYDDGDSTADIDWMWAPNRTDGAAFRGLESDDFDTITIDPGYNEEADEWGSWSYSGADEHRIDAWKVKGEGGETVGELELDQEVSISAGSCGGSSGPTANIDAPDTTGAGEGITFDGSGSTDDGEIVEYRWEFGDGTAATGESVDHSYDEPGTYTVTLTVEDDAGNTGNASTEVTVESAANEPPNASFTAPSNATVNESVEFDARGSTDDDGIAEYRWDFDTDGTVDRNTDETVIQHPFEAAGEVTVTLTVVDTENGTDSATRTLTVEEAATNAPPTASLSAPASATVNQSVELDASGSTDDGEIAEYRWDVDGDGTIDGNTTDSTYDHAYATAGDHTPTVTVVDADGETATATATVSVSESAELSAAIDASATEVAPNDSVTFDAGASTPADDIVDYRWEFGDGTNGTGATVDHSYDEPGTYTVTLTVTGTANGTATTSTDVTVAEDDGNGGDSGGSPPPSGGNGGDGNNGAPPSSGGGGGGGGQPAPDPEPVYELSALNATTTDLVAGGNATFSTTVTNTGDGAGTKDVEFEVDGTTVANETVRLSPGENATVSFTHRFAEPGNYTVELDTDRRTEVRVRPRTPDLSVTDVSASDDTVTTNEPVRVNATVHNAGQAEGTMELRLRMFGEVVDARTVSVPAGERRTVSFARQVNAPGTYTASVAGRNVTVEVVEVSDDSGPTASAATETATPGFTAVVAVVALLACAVAAVARRER